MAIPARKLLIFPVAGQAASEIVISTKKARTCFYISIIINEEKKILRTYFRIPKTYSFNAYGPGCPSFPSLLPLSSLLFLNHDYGLPSSIFFHLTYFHLSSLPKSLSLVLVYLWRENALFSFVSMDLLDRPSLSYDLGAVESCVSDLF